MKLLTDLWLACEGLVGLIVVSSVVYAVRRRPAFGFLLMGIVALTSWGGPTAPALLSPGGNSIYPADLIVLIVVLARPRRISARSGPAWTGYTIAAIIAANYLRGISAHGLGQATQEFRLLAFPFAALWWASGLDPNDESLQRDLRRLFAVLGWCLVLLAGYNVARDGLGNASSGTYTASGEFLTGRPLESPPSLFLSLCLLAQFDRRFAAARPVMRFASITAFSVAVLVVQQRDVWAATVAAVLVLTLSGGTTGRRARLAAGLAATAFVAFVISGAAGSLLTELSQSLTSSGTYQARTESWVQFVSQWSHYPIWDKLFGQGLGYGFGRYTGGVWVTFQPHNWYVLCLIRLGLVGLATVIMAVISTFVLAVTRGKYYAAAVIASTAVYGWAYSWEWFTLLPTGLAIVDVLAPAAMSSGIPETIRNRFIPGAGYRPQRRSL